MGETDEKNGKENSYKVSDRMQDERVSEGKMKEKVNVNA